MKFKIYHITLLKILGTVILVLLLLNLISVWIQYTVEEKRALHHFYIRIFDFNQEGNIPAFFSSLLLFLASILLYIIYRHEKKKKQRSLGWLGLSLVFAFLTLDEATQIHEFLIGHTREVFDASGYFYYAWVIPYSVALLLLILVYLPFFKNLNQKMFLLMMLSGGIFVSGAIGMEMLGGNVIDNDGFGILYMAYYTLEETLEMIGVSIFIVSLIWFLSTKRNKISFKIKPAPN